MVAQALSKIWVVLPAGGSGVRMQADSSAPSPKTRKQYLMLGGKTILERSIACFDALSFVSGIVAVLPEDDCASFDGDRLKACYPRFCGVVSGGQTRFDSVKNGVLFLNERGAQAGDWMMIHDAVRPLVSELLCVRVIERAKQVGAAIAALPIKGTVKQVDGSGRILGTVDRTHLCEAQTPQVFAAGALMRAYAAVDKWDQAMRASITDEGMLLEHMGERVDWVVGEETNLKITRPLDLKLAEALIAPDVPK